MDSHKRSVAKTISWRFFASLVTLGVTYLILSLFTSQPQTNKMKFATLVALLASFYQRKVQ